MGCNGSKNQTQQKAPDVAVIAPNQAESAVAEPVPGDASKEADVFDFQVTVQKVGDKTLGLELAVHETYLSVKSVREGTLMEAWNTANSDKDEIVRKDDRLIAANDANGNADEILKVLKGFEAELKLTIRRVLEKVDEASASNRLMSDAAKAPEETELNAKEEQATADGVAADGEKAEQAAVEQTAGQTDSAAENVKNLFQPEAKKDEKEEGKALVMKLKDVAQLVPNQDNFGEADITVNDRISLDDDKDGGKKCICGW